MCDKRDISNVECEVCGNTYSSVGMYTHLKYSHDMSVDEYVSGPGTEYRKKYLNKTYDYKCRACGEKCSSEKALTFHVKNEHNMSKEKYGITYYHGGTRPTCKCGCGEETSFITHEPYFREYISGHNSKGENNPMYGRSHSDETKKKMRKRKEVSFHERLKHRRLILTDDSYPGFENKPPYSKYEFECKDCGNTFSSTVKCSRIPTCPHCKHGGRSKPERDIYHFLKNELEISHVHQSNRTFLDGSLELDLYMPDHSFAIEYDGLHWHTEEHGGKTRSYHLNKTRACEEKGIHLFHIFGDEWRNSPGIVKSRIANKLKCIQDIDYARETSLKKIDNPSLKNEFMNKHHLQGEDRSTHKYGLFSNSDDQLVSVMTFSRPRVFMNKSHSNSETKQSSEDIWEISRFASVKNKVVVGAFGKLFSHFLKNHSPSKIISYADRRYTSSLSNVYDHFDFELMSEGVPGYWYVDPSYNSRMHRYSFTKHKIIEDMNGDPSISEWENMKNMNYDRIWDCGHLKYVWYA